MYLIYIFDFNRIYKSHPLPVHFMQISIIRVSTYGVNASKSNRNNMDEVRTKIA